MWAQHNTGVALMHRAPREGHWPRRAPSGPWGSPPWLPARGARLGEGLSDLGVLRKPTGTEACQSEWVTSYGKGDTCSIWVAKTSGSLVGRLQTRRSQTYAVGCPPTATF